VPVPDDRPVVTSFAVVLLVYAALVLSVYILRDAFAFLASYLALLVASALCGVAVYRDARAIEGLGRARGVRVFGWFKPSNWALASFLMPAAAVPTYLLYARRRALRKLG
jgi:glucan phosphoethanolaminetransferase (alkaline phosphatase superfamily)